MKKDVFKLFITLKLSLVLVTCQTMAQNIFIKNIDIAGGLKDSSIIASVYPNGTDISRAFDGNEFVQMYVLTSDSISIMLQFLKPVISFRTKVFFYNEGYYTIDGAETQNDLDSKTGTYFVLKNQGPLTINQWDSVSFTPRTLKFIRLRAKNTASTYIMLGEWALLEQHIFVSYFVTPNPPRLIPGQPLRFRVKMLDNKGLLYPVPSFETLNWSITDTTIAKVDQNGIVTGNNIGKTELVIENDSRTLTGRFPVTVETDFQLPKVPPMTIKVALVLPDPIIPGGMRLHQKYGWRDPRYLSDLLVKHFREATDGVLNFEFVELIYTDTTFARVKGGPILNVTSWMYLFNLGQLQKPDAGVQFDYRELVRHYSFDIKRNNGLIDEVWVFSPPYTGMYESQLMGPNAFWWNSPPIKDGTSLTKLLSVMGLNYERGVDQAFHSFGHRSESAIAEAYRRAWDRDWNPLSPDPTPWDLFTRYDKIIPGEAQVGNIHFPPNGQSDYDYGNLLKVTSYAENWKRYPYIFRQNRQVDVGEWYYTDYEPMAEGQDHIGYLRWWYGHLPRYVGVTDGVLNNWWHYIVDFEGAVALAAKTPISGIENKINSLYPEECRLEQNFPNPFNPITTISYYLPAGQAGLSAKSFVKLTIYDILGREIAILVKEVKNTGTHFINWNASKYPSGTYFCQLRAGSIIKTIRMVLLK